MLLIISMLFFSIRFFESKSTIDFNINDTYYVITNKDLNFFLCYIFLILFLLYFIVDLLKIISINWFSKMHIYATILLIALMKINFLFANSNFNLTEKYYTNNSFIFKNELKLNFFGLIFLLLQLLFFINIFVSIIIKTKEFK